MSGIHSVDLKRFVAHSVKSVFETMLSMRLEPEDPPNRQSVTTGQHVVGTVGFAGVIMGNVNIFVSREFARAMTAAMLGMAVEDIGSDEEVNDVIGEVCNMVGGDLKSRLCDAGFTCSLSIPSITYGDSFKVESKGWDRHEQLGFRNSHHSALLEVYIKSPN
jgi:CheY-specific phosphatase CheX